MENRIEEIINQMIVAKNNDVELSAINSTSKTSLWRLFMSIVATSIFKLEQIFQYHQESVNLTIREQKPHTTRWYRNKALAFQYGFDLIKDSDVFDNNNVTEEEIDNSKIIKYSAVTETEKAVLIIKIAKEDNKVLSPVNSSEFTSFKAYISEVKDAGVKTQIINYLPDRLRLSVRIIRDALVLNELGLHINDGNYPVNDLINDFLQNLPFNGELSILKLEAAILNLNGVEDVSIDLAESSWIDPTIDDYGTYQPIDISQIPVSGYYELNLENDDPTKSTIVYV